MSRHACGILAVGLFGLPGAVEGGATSAAVREATEAVSKALGREAIDQGRDLAHRLEALVARYGDDALTAVRKCGPRGLAAIEAAGPRGDQIARLLARHGDEALRVIGRPSQLRLCLAYGDDGARALIRHGEIAERLVVSSGREAARALAPIMSRNARRLVLLARSGELQRMGRTEEVFEVIARFGDRAMDFIWRHKGALTVTAALTAFLRDPEPFLDGVTSLAEVAGRHVLQPAIEAGGRVGVAIVKRIPWVWAALVAASVIAVTVRRRRHAASHVSQSRPEPQA